VWDAMMVNICCLIFYRRTHNIPIINAYQSMPCQRDTKDTYGINLSYRLQFTYFLLFAYIGMLTIKSNNLTHQNLSIGSLI
jgi:hypothetical protein